MFDYTKAAVDIIIQGFKKMIFWIAFSTQSFTIAYLLYTLIAQTGNPVVNGSLLLISVASFVYFIYKYKKEEKDKNKNVIKHIFSFSKLAIKLFNLGIIIYGFYTAATVSPITLIMTVFMIIGWILQILFEIIAVVIDCLKRFLLEAIQADINSIKKPLVSTGNFFKRLFGKEVQETEQSNTQQRLGEHIQTRKERKRKEKEMKKAAKKAAKQISAITGEIAAGEDEN